ncbi:MAG: O-antigen ligase family protein [Chloroflexi bacterium]|nr:O-antigen ligase family protein [Chloroflexota bacterium]
MAFLIPVVWLATAALYLASKRAAAVLYLLALPAFPFYWAPLYLVPFNNLSIQRVVAAGIALGIIIETAGGLHRRQLRFERLRVELMVGLMICMWSVSGFEQGSFSAGVRGTAFNVLDFWLPFALALRVAEGAEGIQFLLKWLAWPALGVALLTAYEYSTQAPAAWKWFRTVSSGTSENVWVPTLRADMLRVQATLGESIFLGFYLAFAGLALLVLTGMSPAAKRGWGYFAAGLLFVTSLLPMARGSMISSVVALLIFVVFASGKMRWRVLVGIVPAATLLWLVAGAMEDTGAFWSDFLLTLVGNAPSHVQSQQLGNWDYRVDLVQTGFEIIASAPPFGYGDVSVGGAWPILDIANVFVEVGIVSGPLGLAAFLAFLVMVCVKLLRTRLRGTRESEVLESSGLLALLALVLGSWLDASWPGQFTQIGWIVLGVVMSLSRPGFVTECAGCFSRGRHREVGPGQMLAGSDAIGG